MNGDVVALDPRGLMREAFAMDGLGATECRSIFLDWALGLPAGTDAVAAVAALLAHYGPTHPAHPMTAVLREGAARRATPRRRPR